MTRWFAILPLLALLGLAIVGGQNLLREEKPTTSLSDNRPAPTRSFPVLQSADAIQFSPPNEGEPIVVNLFASWCAPCVAEHPLLIELGQRHPGRLHGLLYRDTPTNGAAFLERLGDPFHIVGVDEDGQGGLDFGLTGVPETFVIGADGTVILHIRGPLSPKDLDRIGGLL
ncbi:MAG: redoxin family protein [Pseudomonadota bacterium]